LTGRVGCRPHPPGSLQCSPNILAGFNGWALGKKKEREGTSSIKWGGGRGKEEEVGEERREERKRENEVKFC